VGQEVEAGVCPGVEITGAAECEARGGGFHLADVVDDGDGDVVAAIEETQESEDGGDAAGVVLVLLVEADEGVEDEEAGVVLEEGGLDSVLVVGPVQEEAWSGNQADEQWVEVDAGGRRDGSSPFPKCRGRVFSSVEEDGTWSMDGESTEEGGSGGDGDGEVEAEPGLVRLGRTANKADGVFSPHPFDEPGDGGGFGDACETGDREGLRHGQAPFFRCWEEREG
jgi:hypothetical protein